MTDLLVGQYPIKISADCRLEGERWRHEVTSGMKFEEQIENLKRMIEHDAELLQQSREVMEDLERRLRSADRSGGKNGNSSQSGCGSSH